MTKINLTAGTTFSNATLVRETTILVKYKTKTLHRRAWVIRLSTGYEKTIREEILLRTIASGGKFREEREETYPTLKTSFKVYKATALKKNRVFAISFDQFTTLIQGICHYCNDFSKDITRTKNTNGVDRKNPDMGYILENCVTCCKSCNYMKRDDGYEQFLAKIKNIYTTLNL